MNMRTRTMVNKINNTYNSMCMSSDSIVLYSNPYINNPLYDVLLMPLALPKTTNKKPTRR